MISTVAAAVPIVPLDVKFASASTSNRVDPALCNVAFGVAVPIQSLFVLPL